MEDDIADLATKETEILTYALISGVQSQLRYNQTNSGTSCIECQGEIPPERRQVLPNISRCKKCQEEFENHQSPVRYSTFSIATIEEEEKEEEND